jgi:hypothetical protein
LQQIPGSWEVAFVSGYLSEQLVVYLIAQSKALLDPSFGPLLGPFLGPCNNLALNIFFLWQLVPILLQLNKDRTQLHILIRLIRARQLIHPLTTILPLNRTEELLTPIIEPILVLELGLEVIRITPV